MNVLMNVYLFNLYFIYNLCNEGNREELSSREIRGYWRFSRNCSGIFI